MPRVHVMAAALVDSQDRVLIARRAAGTHQGGLWEFPGGKREAGESREQALARELDEELGIRILEQRPLIQVAHDYPDRRVLLDVWRVCRWQGRVRALEGQPLAWVRPGQLSGYAFPAADAPVLKALSLPRRYLITPAPGADHEAWLQGLQASLDSGIALVQIRIPGLETEKFLALAERAVRLCRRRRPRARVLINAHTALAMDCGADGEHLNRERLWAASAPAPGEGWLRGASCHDGADLGQAQAAGVDFAVLSPVAATRSHPGARLLGWKGFETLVAGTTLPVYALGGMTAADLDTAHAAGAQGIAAIRGLWAGPPGA